MTTPLWQPTLQQRQQSNLQHYMDSLRDTRNQSFDDYDTLWTWSAGDPGAFWGSLWDYFKIESATPYSQVMSDDPMPFTRWFEGATLNYVSHIFRERKADDIAVYHSTEQTPLTTLTWGELEEKVRQVAAFLQASGVKKGDRVVAYLPNVPEAMIGFLATASLGAIWSSCSPDFGTASIIDRFKQIEPKVMFACTSYGYGGKIFNREQVVSELQELLPSLRHTILTGQRPAPESGLNGLFWDDLLAHYPTPPALTPLAVPFDHPLYILFSSGTTGIPKAIVHGHGGILLEHLKYVTFHNDVRPGENFFWYSTTGWMMWNFCVSALLAGARVVLFDGSPAYLDLTTLWRMADELPIHHFGTSAPFLISCMKVRLPVNELYSLTHLRSIGSTGSPLPPEAFEYVYQYIKKDVWLASMSGGTDVCTAWVGGNPLKPVYTGEIQCRCLGCAMDSYDELGHPVRNAVGEMVVTQPMPSMPVFFWNDPDHEKYLASYFEHYAGIWRHGDWLNITDRGTLMILGRSDATLNRQGIRIGTAEIYRVMDSISAVKDSLIVNLELTGGQHFMPLFVVLKPGNELTNELKKAINTALRTAYSPRHVPDDIIEIEDIPYTISGKKLEAPVKKVLMGIPVEKAANLGSVRNPSAIDIFVRWRASFFDGQESMK